MEPLSPSSLLAKVCETDGMDQNVLLARHQLREGAIVAFRGDKKARNELLVGSATLVSTSQSAQVRFRTAPSRGAYYTTITCAGDTACSVSNLFFPPFTSCPLNLCFVSSVLLPSLAKRAI